MQILSIFLQPIFLHFTDFSFSQICSIFTHTFLLSFEAMILLQLFRQCFDSFLGCVLSVTREWILSLISSLENNNKKYRKQMRDR